MSSVQSPRSVTDDGGSVSVSILLCGHNSKPDLLDRALRACVDQVGLTLDDELLVVDSGSSPPLAIPSAYSSCVRLHREDEPGLARARVRGIRESHGDVIVFVDDDTVLDPGYVGSALNILEHRPSLGAVGGQLIPAYLGPLILPERYYRERLPIREFNGDHWSNRWDDFATTPIGGGMVVRRVAAEEWARQFESTSWRRALGRTGTSLAGGEDFDLMHTVCGMGLGKGVFEALRLKHLMPPERLQPDFLIRLTEGNSRSWAYLRGMLDHKAPIPPRTLVHRFRVCVQTWRMRGLDRQLFLAEQRGHWQGWAAVARERELVVNT